MRPTIDETLSELSEDIDHIGKDEGLITPDKKIVAATKRLKTEEAESKVFNPEEKSAIDNAAKEEPIEDDNEMLNMTSKSCKATAKSTPVMLKQSSVSPRGGSPITSSLDEELTPIRDFDPNGSLMKSTLDKRD